MSDHPTDRSWQADLIARYPDLFVQEIRGRTTTPGYPAVGEGWRDLVETVVARIAAASLDSGSLKIGQIKEKFGTLRLYLDRCDGLPEASLSVINEAISLGEARSACTCETCGAEGRLYDASGWFLTACERHAKGTVVEVRPGRENIRIVRALKDGKLSIVSCRRYVRDTDSFVDVAPASLGIKE
jgi:hypothetical protein